MLCTRMAIRGKTKAIGVFLFAPTVLAMAAFCLASLCDWVCCTAAYGEELVSQLWSQTRFIKFVLLTAYRK